jgi:hypothetical protein
VALYTGKDGNVKIATNTVAEMDKWTLQIQHKQDEAAAFGDSWDEPESARGSWSGSFSGRAVDSDANGQDALRTAAINGTVVALRLYIDSDSYWSGNAYISLNHDVDAGAANQTISYNFTGKGAVSYT